MGADRPLPCLHPCLLTPGREPVMRPCCAAALCWPDILASSEPPMQPGVARSKRHLVPVSEHVQDMAAAGAKSVQPAEGDRASASYDKLTKQCTGRNGRRLWPVPCLRPLLQPLLQEPVMQP